MQKSQDSAKTKTKAQQTDHPILQTHHATRVVNKHNRTTSSQGNVDKRELEHDVAVRGIPVHATAMQRLIPVDSLWLADSHGHAQGLETVVALRVDHHGLLHHAVGWRRMVTVGNRVQRGRDIVARLGRRGGVLKRAQLVLARVFLILFARKVEAAFPSVTAVVCALVSAERARSVRGI
jgi:hypothetical protein